MEEKMPSQEQDWSSARRLIGNGQLSVIMPVYNLGKSIANNIKTVLSVFSGKIPFEIIVVDDGSADQSKDEIQKITGQHSNIKPVFMKRNVGKGAALKQGFFASSGNYILFLDGDLDIQPEHTAEFFDIMDERNVDMVIGSKHHPHSTVTSYPWHRKLVSSVYYGIVKMLMGLPLRDTQTGIKLFKREVLAFTFPRMLVKQFAFDIELLVVANERRYRFAESPISLNAGARWPMVRPTAVIEVIRDTLAVFYRLKILQFYRRMADTKMPEPAPLVSIVIAYPTATAYLDECLDGIAGQTYTNYEIILLPDETSNRKWPQNIREIPTGRIRPAEKRNIGIKEAKGSITALLDDDAAPLESWLRQAVVYFSDETIAAVGGPA